MFVKGGLIMLLKMVFLIYIQVIHKTLDTIGYIGYEFDVEECFPFLSLAYIQMSRKNTMESR